MTVPTRTVLELPRTGLGQALGRGLEAGVQTGLQTSLKNFLQQQEALEKGRGRFSEEELVARGFTKEEARLFNTLSEGGKTSLGQSVVERIQREKGQSPFAITETPEEASVKNEIATQDIGLTPKELIKREEGRFKANIDRFSNAEKKATGFEQEALKIGQLKELNETGDLPEKLGRLNISFKTGELRIPFLASPDAQLFVKTVNDFLVGAKDTFGARVTNFEIDRFLKRLPTLANSREGRRLILRQMEIINKINSLHDQGILDVFEEAGGIRKIDFDKATSLSRKKNLPLINELKREFVQIPKEKPAEEAEPIEFTKGQTFTELPKKAAEGAIMSRGNERFIFRKGKWSKL